MDWATFWAIFSQTHLVALFGNPDIWIQRRSDLSTLSGRVTPFLMLQTQGPEFASQG
jgi:hypothetical protein